MKNIIIITTMAAFLTFNAFSQNTWKDKFSIEKQEKDSKGFINRLHIYVHNKQNVKQINDLLFKKFNIHGIKSLQIYYYDDKLTAQIYSTKLFDKKTSENEIARLGKHLIGKFEFISRTNHKSLYIGENADLH